MYNPSHIVSSDLVSFVRSCKMLWGGPELELGVPGCDSTAFIAFKHGSYISQTPSGDFVFFAVKPNWLTECCVQVS